jgi:hypothetical protein
MNFTDLRALKPAVWTALRIPIEKSSAAVFGVPKRVLELAGSAEVGNAAG